MKLFTTIETLPIPSDDFLAQKSQAPFFRDALQSTVSKTDLTPSQLQYGIFNYLPGWVNSLMSVRNKIVKVFGFDVGENNMAPASDELNVGDKAGFMTIIDKFDDEIISYADDKHMSFYLSVKKSADKVIVSTLVNQKTLIGKIYVNAILPFHYFIARIVINNAVKSKRI